MERFFKRIKITKITEVDNPHYPTPSLEEYEDEYYEKYTLPNEYSASGYLLEQITIGKTCKIAKQLRHNNRSIGFITTSIVQKISLEDNNVIIFETMNSVYKAEYLEDWGEKWVDIKILRN